jgi:hypothetical protein
VAARLVTQERAKVWVYRLLVVVPSIVQLLIVDSGKCLQHA